MKVLVKVKSVSLTIDGKKIGAARGEKVLWAALDNDIYIPNLCAIREKSEPFASCRLCFVEVEGKDNPVTACTTPVTEGMVVNTQGAKALRLVRTALELLLASHPVDCAHCLKNGSCELQRIAEHLGVKLKTKRFRKILPELPIDSSSPLFIYDPNKCVLCGRCVWVCQEKLGKGTIGFAYRGFRRMVTTFGDEPMGRSSCQDCSECVAVCPVGALVFRKVM
ncbi:MAG: 2Fe-2S iron-sulfur cluster-binding protein [Dehalococcoidia bacterium]|nr:2Fe-2S iron-sulfur cluster-binding protein [Dehalococcoidia bacterium]